MNVRFPRPLAAATAALFALAACGGGNSATTGQAKADVRFGLIYSRSGLLASYGQQYIDGFRIGLDYVTRGTGRVNGHRVVYTEIDDAGDPAKAVTAAKDLIGQGYRIIGGSISSGVALQVAPVAAQNQVLFISGAAATDAITGINRYTFRSGRQTFQDILTARGMLSGLAGKKVLVLAQDSAFGQGYVAGAKAAFGPDGATVSSVLVPLSANDFTPFVQQVKTARPDLLFLAWAGATATALNTALDQQGVIGAIPIATGLDQRASYPTIGPAATKEQFLSHYVYNAPSNAANAALVSALKKDGKTADIFNPDGFVAAQLLAHAIDRADGDGDVNRMIAALEGYSFLAPKGQTTVRAADHAMVQPMFIVRLTQSGAGYDSEPVKTMAPDQVAPPVVAMKS